MSTLIDTVRVLVVDDVTDIRKLIRMTLERAGPFDVVGEAGDGESAITEAARLQPDIVVLDLSMPVMDGLEALPEILRASPNSKVLVLSGFTANEMGAEALRLGAAAYMEKGGIVVKLGAVLRELVPFHIPAYTPPPTTGELFAQLIHDLWRPLTVLHALASRLLHDEDLPREAVRSALEAIAREARHLESILQTYSDTGKLAVGGLDLSLMPTNLPQLVRELVNEVTDITAAHPVALDMRDRVVINVDAMRIRHVLLTLLSNAAKFSPANAPIEVKAALADDLFEVQVRDYGEALADERLASGLALYISREIARAHGGDVFLASCDESGCVFALRLRLKP